MRGCSLSRGAVLVALGGFQTDPSALSPPELPLEVLSTMRCYVRHFFGCQECAEHFEAMAAKSMDKVASREEAILWLWSHHNEVNARLAGKGTATRGGKRRRWRNSPPLGWVWQMAAGCGSGDILLSLSLIPGDSSWSHSITLPRRYSWI